MNPNYHTEMYNDGFEAAIDGYPISVNPYALKKNRISWERGWNAGSKQKADMEARSEETQRQDDYDSASEGHP